MIATAKKMYRHLPPGARDVAASSYGWYLRWWRYGRDTDRLVAAALARETWSEQQWRDYRGDRLRTLLERAATHVPYYREQWRTRRAAGDVSAIDDLGNWPVLDKCTVRANPKAFLADDVRASRLFRLSTSGTSGTPITTWRSRRTSQGWYALFEARNRRWYGIDRGTPWAILGGQAVTPAAQTMPPFWVWNAALGQLYLSTLHLSEQNAAAYVQALERHNVRHLYGYASSMYWLAQMIRESGLAAPKLAVAVSNAEPLHPHQRTLISDVFGCPVRDTYGLSEIVAAGSECEHGTMHTWPDAGVIEIVGDHATEAVERGVPGRIVSTGLLNVDMPLIRYDTGDRASLSLASDGGCECGRTLPGIDRIEGRVTDNLLTADGRRIFWINPVFYDLPIREAQVVQRAIDRIRVNVVPDMGFDDDVESAITQRLRQRVGAVHVEVHRLTSIPRGANGKFKAVVNAIELGMAVGATSVVMGSPRDADHTAVTTANTG